MKKIVYKFICKVELFAERVYNRTGLDIFPPKWRVAVKDRLDPIPNDVYSAFYEAGGDIEKFCAWFESSRENARQFML